MFSGTSDWADSKIARLVANQSSRLGSCWTPGRPRVHGRGAARSGVGRGGAVVAGAVLFGRDAVLAATCRWCAAAV